MAVSGERRVENEREYHNTRFGEERDIREGLDRWYAAVHRGQQEQDDRVRQYARGGVVLEYGCAGGDLTLGTLRLQELARVAHGIDISDKAIEKASQRAKKMGVSNAFFETMNAEQMTYPDKMFDLVFGRGIIHHLDLRRAYGEISRVVKPGGKVLFLEPMGHNPLINWYRNRTPNMRTSDEHPLVMRDFALAREYFSRVDSAFYGLATLAAVPLGRSATGRLAMRAFESLDAVLLRVPGIRRNAWVTLMTLTR